MPMPQFTVQELKADVQDHFEEQADLSPGKYAAFNWVNLFAKVDQLLQNLGPVITTLTPPQYAAMVQLVIAAVHGLDSGFQVNPDSGVAEG